MSAELKAFRIGDVQIDLPVVLGALAGYSDPPYRLICRGLGAPMCSTEMMLDRCLLVKSRKLPRPLQISDRDHPIAGQIIGNDPETMARAATVLCDRGFDVIDLNFACPVQKVLRRRRGGALLKDPELAVEITRAVIAASDRPVTLKLRPSFRDTDAECSAFRHIAEGAFDAGAAAICIHARSVEAKYTGKADWEFIAAVKRRFADKTIIGSGDVLTPQAALDMLDRTSVDAVSVARGALGNPWFFRQVRDLSAGREPYRPSLAEQRRVMADHFARAADFYGPKRGPRIMRKFGIKYARMHAAPKKLRMAFVAVKSAEDWSAVLGTFYEDDPAPGR